MPADIQTDGQSDRYDKANGRLSRFTPARPEILSVQWVARGLNLYHAGPSDPLALKRRSAAAQLPRLWVRIPPSA